jgi:hypothetical protein
VFHRIVGLFLHIALFGLLLGQPHQLFGQIKDSVKDSQGHYFVCAPISLVDEFEERNSLETGEEDNKALTSLNIQPTHNSRIQSKGQTFTSSVLVNASKSERGPPKAI